MDAYNTNRKVVLVRGDKSKGYEQAIFILRADGYRKSVDFMKEAEKIVQTRNFSGKNAAPKFDYASYAQAEMLPAPSPPQTVARAVPKKAKTRNRFDTMLNFALIVTGLAVVVLFALNFM